MAEFDSVGCEGLSEDSLILSPHLKYAIATPDSGLFRRLRRGTEGELLIRFRREAADWYHTHDLVRVIDRAPSDEILWPGSWRIEHLGRTDNVLKLPDGSLVSAEQLDEVAQKLPGIEYIQLQLIRSTSAPARLRLLVSPCQEVCPPSKVEIEALLMERCFELADAVKYNVVFVEVLLVSVSQLKRTPRGKIQSFVEINT